MHELAGSPTRMFLSTWTRPCVGIWYHNRHALQYIVNAPAYVPDNCLPTWRLHTACFSRLLLALVVYMSYSTTSKCPSLGKHWKWLCFLDVQSLRLHDPSFCRRVINGQLAEQGVSRSVCVPLLGMSSRHDSGGSLRCFALFGAITAGSIMFRVLLLFMNKV
jgi:hypothetical protein